MSLPNIIKSKLFDASLSSYIKLRNNKGLSIEPCGAPHTIF